jgi:hypothetical protein
MPTIPAPINKIVIVGGGGISLTTIKDRERANLSDLTITDFTIDYLVNIAGWTL